MCFVVVAADVGRIPLYWSIRSGFSASFFTPALVYFIHLFAMVCGLFFWGFEDEMVKM